MIHNKIILWMAAALLTLTTACTENDILKADMPQEPTKPHTYRLSIDMPVPSHDGQTTRANTEWEDGSQVEFKFYISGTNGTYNTVSGLATYSSTKKEWSLVPEVEFPSDRTMTDCEARYYQSQADYDNDFLTAVYYGTTSYSLYDDQILCGSISLKPTNWRLRFQGETGVQMNLISKSIKHSVGGELDSSELSELESDTLSLTVADDGYTPYIYGTFNNKTGDNTITVETGGHKYSRTISGTALKPGETGYIVIPTEDNYEAEGWTKVDDSSNEDVESQTFTVIGNGKTVTFKMIHVEAGTFQMGATAEQGSDADDDEKPAHSVTLTKDYWIGETEVTQALWQAVMGQTPTSDGSKWSSTYGLGDNRPAYYVSWNDICGTDGTGTSTACFLYKLNKLLEDQGLLPAGKKLRLPTDAEWEYAARGGSKSKGYKYAGSNTIDDVAWYEVNSYYKGSSSPDYGTHDVATKQANELGLYDMSGNVYEWCSDWYSSSYYSSSPSTDPTGPSTGSFRVYRGGGWNYYARSCRVADRSGSTPTRRSNFLGLRLAL